jgi:hypothetical protein
MPDKKMGRPKARRQFRFDPRGSAHGEEYGCWMENINYVSGAKKAEQPAAEWVDANCAPTTNADGDPVGKPLPAGEDWGTPPDAMKFVRLWQRATSIEEVYEDIWWCSVRQLRSHRSDINAYLVAKNFQKLKILRSKRHLFGNTSSSADRNIKKLLDEGIIRYRPKAERDAEAAAKASKPRTAAGNKKAHS